MGWASRSRLYGNAQITEFARVFTGLWFGKRGQQRVERRQFRADADVGGEA